MPRLYQAAPRASTRIPSKGSPPGSPRVPPGATFAVLAVGTIAFALTQTLVTPVLPVIQRDLHASAGTVTWVLTAWLLAASVATPLLGRIGDMIGKERALLIALASIFVGCLIAAIAPSIGLLVAGRVLQGLGGAVFPISFGILRDEFPPKRVGSALGGMAAVIAAGSGLGIVLAGPIVELFGWRSLFWLPMGLAAAVGVLAWRLIPASPVRDRRQPNWLAALLLSGWLVALLLALSKAAAWGWVAGRTLALLAAAAVLLVGWLATEMRSATPLIDMRMMRLPAVWTTNLVALLFGAVMFATLGFLPQFIQVPASAGYGFGASVTGAGLLMLPMLVTMALFGSASGPLARWVGSKAQLLWGAGCTTAATVALALYHRQAWEVAVAGAVFGIGLGLIYATMIALIVRSVPQHQTGAASGMNTNIRTIGGSIGTAVVGSILASHPGAHGLPAQTGYTTAFLVLAGAGAVAFAVALLVPRSARSAG